MGSFGARPPTLHLNTSKYFVASARLEARFAVGLRALECAPETHKKPVYLSRLRRYFKTDLLVLASMKIAAKCDEVMRIAEFGQ